MLMPGAAQVNRLVRGQPAESFFSRSDRTGKSINVRQKSSELFAIDSRICHIGDKERPPTCFILPNTTDQNCVPLLNRERVKGPRRRRRTLFKELCLKEHPPHAFSCFMF